MISDTVRVRFAPSPTGFFHIGSARTALFNWLYARHTGGKLILRIEDTDKERNNEESLQSLLAGMGWLGLDWQEGPEVGGDYGPYFQSQRQDIYKKYIDQLKADGKIYEKEGAWWLKISEEVQVISDAVRGRVERKEDKDFVVVRSNGDPVFHLVNVVDDIEMKITHVIRGEDHLSNTSKHLELFKAIGAEPPVFAHIPLILKSEGAGKMSKRDKGALVEEYQERSFLPEALRNYLCLLGWAPKDDQEILPIEEIIEQFELNKVSKNNARFDEKKLDFINSHYVKALPIETLAWMARPVLTEAGVFPEDGDEDHLQNVLEIAQEKMRSFETLSDFLKPFFQDEYPEDDKAKRKALKKEGTLDKLDAFIKGCEAHTEAWDAELLEALLGSVASAHGFESKELMLPIRVAVTGQSVGPGLYRTLAVLGQEKAVLRMKNFIANNQLSTV